MASATASSTGSQPTTRLSTTGSRQSSGPGTWTAAAGSGRRRCSCTCSRTAPMPSGAWTLAIDFGTTATSAATLAGGEVHVVRIDSDDRMPSMVFWREPDGEDPGELLLGEVADRWAPLAPECLERAPKRR